MKNHFDYFEGDVEKIWETHTDDIGNDIDNQILSEKRSRSVKAYLVSKGISENRIVCVGYGELHPIADNKESSGRLKNRRTEIRILK